MRMLLTITQESMEMETRDGFHLVLPRFLWTVLENMAVRQHQGNLQKTVEELSLHLFLDWFGSSVKQCLEVPPSDKMIYN